MERTENAARAIHVDLDESILIEEPAPGVAPNRAADLSAYLYGEALRFAEDAEYDRALRALGQLRAFDPANGAAHLLVARVQVALQHWPEAVFALGVAERCGVAVPSLLRDVAFRGLERERPAFRDRADPLAQDVVGGLPAPRFEINDNVLSGEGFSVMAKPALDQLWDRFPEVDAILLFDPGDAPAPRPAPPVFDLATDVVSRTDALLASPRMGAQPQEIREILTLLAAVLDRLAKVVDR